MAARGPKKPFLWHLRVHPSVTESVARQPEPARLAFKELVDALRVTPRSRALGVMEGKGMPYRNIYSAPIGPDGDVGLLTYQIYSDHPAIHLFNVEFWADYDVPGSKEA